MSSSKPPSTNDQSLEALRRGEREVLHQLFRDLQPRLYRFVWLKTKSVEVAEDIVQETFLRVWRARKKLKTGTRLATFVFRIGNNLATDHVRRDERHKDLDQQNPEAAGVPSAAEEQAEYNQLTQIIDRIVSSLPDAQRTAFLLSRYENLQHKEIAEVMDISVRTVEKHVGKALQTLKEKLSAFDIVLPS
ncbi:MAG: RNA polymerase sigma factor [bacterium]